jgi:hypothetical protein
MGRLILLVIGLMVVVGLVFKTLGFLFKFALIGGIIYLVVKALEQKKLDK